MSKRAAYHRAVSVGVRKIACGTLKRSCHTSKEMALEGSAFNGRGVRQVMTRAPPSFYLINDHHANQLICLLLNDRPFTGLLSSMTHLRSVSDGVLRQAITQDVLFPPLVYNNGLANGYYSKHGRL